MNKIRLRIQRVILFYSSSLLFLTFTSSGQTTVGGLISTNTTWDLSGSPYIVNQNLLVDIGVTLTVDPQVVIKFDSAKSLLVRGTLRAIGNPDGYITFTSNQTTPKSADWGYISFDNESTPYDSVSGSGCVMDYCIVEYAGNAYAYAVGCSEAFIKLSHSILRYNFGTALKAENSYPGTQWITYNAFEWNDISGGGYAMAGVINMLSTGANVVFSGNMIRENLWLSQQFITCAIFAQELTFTDNIFAHNESALIAQLVGNSSLIQRNLFCGNMAGNIVLIGTYAGSDVSDNIIAENKGSGPALRLITAADYPFSKNSIVKNLTWDNPVTVPQFLGDFTNNTITQNLSDNCVVQGSESAYFNFNYCNVFNNYNYISSNTLYNYRSTFQPQGNDFNADFDYWGYTNSNSIDSLIFDYFDDLTTGVVHYSPYLIEPDINAPISPPLNFIKTDLGNNSVQFTWNANPESDVAGYKIYWDTINCYSFHSVEDAGNVNTLTLNNVNFSDTFAITAYDNLLDGVNDQLEGNESWFTYDQLYDPFAIVSIQAVSSTVSVAIYPNPSSGSFTVELVNAAIGEASSIYVMNTLGQNVFSSSEKISSAHWKKEVDLSDAVNGIYFIQIKTKDNFVKKKIIITK